MKQVRFANSSNSSSSSSSSGSSSSGGGAPAVLSNSEAADATTQPDSQDNLGPQLKLLPLNDQIRELQTIIRDK